MSDRPQRTNTYTANATSDRYRQCLFDWLAAQPPLWNQITYRRRQAYFSDDGDVWDADYTDLYDEYAPIIGKATCQQIARKNSEAWRSHFRLLEQYHDNSNTTVTEKPSPPGYWGNRKEGYELHGLVRNDLYTLDWDEDRSTLEFGVGDVLKDRYDFEHNERVTLEIKGNPQWNGDDSRLELIYDDHADQLRVQHPVRIQPDKIREQREDAFTHTLNTENTTQAAAIDVGANNTLAVVTERGDTAVYHARPEFARFQRYSERIATLQSGLPADKYTSSLIQRLYDTRSRSRDHSRDAAVKHVAEWLLERNVDTVYVGDLTDVLDTHWSTDVNEKTHNFWSHRQLLNRIELTLGDVGICVAEVTEADSSSECPECGSSDITRRGDSFRCHDCELDAHSDVAGAWNILQSEAGPMARPAALSAERDRDAPQEGAYWQWNEHDWIPADFGEQSRSVDQPSFSKPASSQPG
ncbi:IS1341-type transposase ISNph17 (plasmid) [Natronomonas pharaonis DSM 2160]|uniref:IS1341-type transposase ISNph17 n=1 Tax=Natronomonas pharaonis (strain ATCC 35678 / DSM 2160 / CIP 103997 / JCM 8858 / NBRC 14720 / NCIMB 2260 / Gabara) TaxID=348780 RepID=Q3IM00_NATPD|nr:RNA-guided endonuclease TnpB family protein [Natronomonas pharaonis]CAI50869.1 IS1341-type transposase ISNph17 [Natronomonas pharaonis DSM 2160]